jgi:hypothetical protein
MNAIGRAIALVIALITTGVQAKTVVPTDSLVIRFANRTRLVIYAPDKAGIQALSSYDLNKIVREMGMKLDSLPDGKTAISQNGERYLKDTVLVITKQKDGVSITINDKDDTSKNSSNSDYQSERNRAQDRRRRHDNVSVDYGFSIGLNNLIQQGANTGPAFPELSPIGSRYVALSIGAIPTLIRGQYVSLKLFYGVEVAWNNFMFEGNNIVTKGPTTVEFPDAGRDLSKSKLTICTLGIPVVPRLTFYNSNGRKVGHFGVGGYINYRLDSYRKIKETDGGTDRRHYDFYLNNYRYGLVAHIGVKSLNFFVKYDLNPLFMPEKGPDVRALSFGIGF